MDLTEEVLFWTKGIHPVAKVIRNGTRSAIKEPGGTQSPLPPPRPCAEGMGDHFPSMTLAEWTWTASTKLGSFPAWRQIF